MTKDMKSNGLRLQVLICAYGKNGIERIADGKHPSVEGVEYLVSWQIDEEYDVPEALKRCDFRIFTSNTKGLSVNRNIALSKATAPLLLISDDDVDYTEDGLISIINAFDNNKSQDIITFRYDSTSDKKQYPSRQCDLANPTKGYFISSIEIAFRRDAVKNKIWFNENFGVGAPFPSGEEDIFLQDCLDKGLKGIFLPITIASHKGETTSERNLMLPSRPQTKGAVFLRLHPRQWPLRMIAHILREIPMWKAGIVPSPIAYALNWIKGAYKAKKYKVFPTPDYSQKYLHNDRS
ncbi:MAG: glycosyltransferase [Muribaculaceae bacterium]|nr:glycosyltransferase [Muribaculaceae bacterium]